MLSDKIKLLLTPEQLVTAERWEKERSLREETIKQFEAGEITAEKYAEVIFSSDKKFCEHDRSIMGTCAACDEIAEIIAKDY